jgi:hypothetical protein
MEKCKTPSSIKAMISVNTLSTKDVSYFPYKAAVEVIILNLSVF